MVIQRCGDLITKRAVHEGEVKKAKAWKWVQTGGRIKHHVKLVGVELLEGCGCSIFLGDEDFEGDI